MKNFLVGGIATIIFSSPVWISALLGHYFLDSAAKGLGIMTFISFAIAAITCIGAGIYFLGESLREQGWYK